jgi:hypothetical protein
MVGNSRFGVCIQGYGKKCHREIECMALGTVPVFFNDEPMASFVEPLREGIHYIKIIDPNQLSDLASISKKTWSELSLNCIKWYSRNAFSSNWFNQTLRAIFHHE